MSALYTFEKRRELALVSRECQMIDPVVIQGASAVKYLIDDLLPASIVICLTCGPQPSKNFGNVLFPAGLVRHG